MPLKPFWERPEFYFRLLFLEEPTGWLLKSGNIISFTGLFFSIPACVSVGPLAEGHGPEDTEKTHRLDENLQGSDSVWPVPGRDTTIRMLGQRGPGQLGISCRLHAALHRLPNSCAFSCGQEKRLLWRRSNSHTTFILQLILVALLQELWVSGSYSPGQFHLSPDE